MGGRDILNYGVLLEALKKDSNEKHFGMKSYVERMYLSPETLKTGKLAVWVRLEK